MEIPEEVNKRANGNVRPRNQGHASAANGVKFVDEVLNGQSQQCFENFRMDKPVFYKLCDILQARGLLRHTNRIKIEEQLAIFLFIVGHNLRTRAVQELFKYSGETISRHFNNVLNAIMAISLELFQLPGTDIPPEIADDSRFYPYFKDCVGAINGINIPVMVGVDEQGPFRNKNGLLSQKVMAAHSFDMKFHYVLAGWEGSASDLQVLNSVITRRNKLEVPEGKYYILDNKYPNLPGFMAPYNGVPYYMGELPTGYLPQDPKEIFNQRHFWLQNASARIFGALKERFPILMSAPPYPLQTQVKLVVATCAIHNFIRQENPDDILFKRYENDVTSIQIEDPLELAHPTMHFDTHGLEAFDTDQVEVLSSELRDGIASDMWDDHLHDLYNQVTV